MLRMLYSYSGNRQTVGSGFPLRQEVGHDPPEVLPGHLRSDDFFDVATHPAITFKSKRVEPGAAGSFTLYEDDGVSRGYARGEFAEQTFTVCPGIPSGVPVSLYGQAQGKTARWPRGRADVSRR